VPAVANKSEGWELVEGCERVAVRFWIANRMSMANHKKMSTKYVFCNFQKSHLPATTESSVVRGI